MTEARDCRRISSEPCLSVFLSVFLLGALTGAQAQIIADPDQERASGDNAQTARSYFLRVRMGDDVPRPAVIHMFGRYRKPVDGQYYPPHANITREGYFKGSNTGISEAGVLSAGQQSPWIDLEPILAPHDRTHLFLDAIVAYRDYLPHVSFTVDISRTYDGSDVLASFARSGTGSGLRLTYDPDEAKLFQCNEEQAPALAQWVTGLPDVPGRRPKAFPILTGAAVDDDRDSDRVVEANLSVLRTTGFNGLSSQGIDPLRLKEAGFTCFDVKGYLQSSWCRERCWLEPNLDTFRTQLERFASRARDTRRTLTPVFWMLGDEYGSRRLERIKDEVRYHPHFRDFLRAQGVTPADVGKESWDAVVPADRDDRLEWPVLYYYSCQFRHEVLATHLRNGSRIVHELLPGVPTCLNFPEAATYHSNLLYSGGDWFRIMEQGDLGFGWTETWLPYNETMQSTAYHYALMRAACRRRGQPYGFYIIVYGRYPWDNDAKAASAVGHGARALHFYNYGPRHNGSSDAWSHKTALYQPLRKVIYGIGAVEDVVLRSHPVRSRAALIYSHSCDIWNLHQSGNPFGAERKGLYLMLQHIGISPEIVTEKDILRGQLEQYDLVFLVDSHLASGVGKRLADWVEQGGVLYCSAGSGMFDQFSRASDVLKPFGIEREPFGVKKGLPWRPMLSYHALESQGDVDWRDQGRIEFTWALQPLVKTTGGDIFLKTRDGRPVAAAYAHGKGRVLYVGFWPAVSYRKTAVVAKRAADGGYRGSAGEANTTTAYAPVYRQFLRDLLDPLPFSPAVSVNDPFIETRLLEYNGGRLLILANWSGQERDVTVRMTGSPDNPPQPMAPTSANSAYREGRWVMDLQLGPFAVIQWMSAKPR